MVQALYQRLNNFIRENSMSPIPITIGAFSVAAMLAAGLYQFHLNRQRHQRRLRDTRIAQQTIRRNRIGKASLYVATNDQTCAIPLHKLRKEFIGIKTITLSAAGVLFRETESKYFEEAATVVPDAIKIIKELATDIHLYIIANVDSDVGAAVISDALESAELIGNDKGQIPKQRLVFCSTIKGKVSVVRQIEPELHIDSTAETIEDLQRFIQYQLQIVSKEGCPAACKTGSIGYGKSLLDALNVKIEK